MDKNKSIDGLQSRRAKTTTSRSSSHKSTSAKTPRTAKKIVKSTKTVKPTKSIKVKPVQPSLADISPKPNAIPATESSEPISRADITADFLSPTHTFDFDEQSGELKATEHPSVASNSNKPKKTKKKMSKKKKIILTIIIIILLLLITAGICFIVWGNDIIAKITGGQGNVFDLVFQDDHYERLKTDENGRTNILAFGTSGYNMEGEEGNGTHDGSQLTDSIMVISLDQDTGDVAMLSLPRDLKASPTCTATGKINEVYWCNGGSGEASTEEEAKAAQALMDEVGNILGIDFQYFAHLNWASLIGIVDTLGGIKVTLDEDILDYNYTKAVFEKGVEYTIDGAQAIGLARARHGTTNGDFSRGASQQKILIGIKNRILEKSLSVTDLMNLAGTLGDNLRTNFSIDEIKSLAHLTSNFDFNTVRQVSLLEPERLMTTGNINGISYVLPVGGAGVYNRIQAYIDKMFSSDPKVYEDATILVLNGTDTAGLASNEKTTLEKDGYQTVYIDDAPAGAYNEEYTLYAINPDKPGTKKLLEEKYHTTAKSSTELPADIDASYDFVLILGATPSETQN